MAMWPFGKKQDDAGADGAESTYEDPTPEVPGSAQAQETTVDGDTGPFDGDTVNIEEFDFSDFSLGILDLGSMRIPLPKRSQVQVEMGEQGPKMVHIVTEFGRITPVAFAAPNSAGQWAESAEQITQGMIGDGLDTELDQGPWGPEVIGQGEHGRIRIVGVEGPRWMLRMTATAPLDRADELRDLTREITARTFVYRGDDPILAGSSLPVVLPKQLVAQVQQAMQERAQQPAQVEQQQVDEVPADDSPEIPQDDK
ncbi:MAG: DUF3710 domain-containing protein [Corynebacterium sp.]|uniref:DUF3710 domain-containing protein n=1 Tax=Corynebacterium sp. TaxID=1720 RepID=UPI0026E0CF56|nr:DUF3710 domain-containing protein [Corynebacterium sp.]MDO5670880.1 DUF3710 domain-containing protein [Corynebacterium sp.]